MGIASFILALAALLLFWLPILAIPLGGTALLLAIIATANGKSKRQQGGSEALTIAGLVIAIIALIPSLLLVLVIMIAAAIAGSLEPAAPETATHDYTTM